MNYFRFSSKDSQPLLAQGIFSDNELSIINDFTKKINPESLKFLSLIEVLNDGKSKIHKTSLRSLYTSINKIVSEIDSQCKGSKKRQTSKDDIDIEVSNSLKNIPSFRIIDEKTSVSEKTDKSQAHNSSSFTKLQESYLEKKKAYIDSFDALENDNYHSSEVILPIQLRDLKILDINLNPTVETTILVRRHCLIFAMDPIRAVIFHDRLLIIVPLENELGSIPFLLAEYVKGFSFFIFLFHYISIFIYKVLFNIQDWCKEEEGRSLNFFHFSEIENSLPSKKSYINKFSEDEKSSFEIFIMETFLAIVGSIHNQDINYLSNSINNILDKLKPGKYLSPENQDELRLLKNHLSTISKNIVKCKKELSEIIEDDEEMALMNISLLKDNPSLYRLIFIIALLINKLT